MLPSPIFLPVYKEVDALFTLCQARLFPRAGTNSASLRHCSPAVNSLSSPFSVCCRGPSLIQKVCRVRHNLSSCLGTFSWIHGDSLACETFKNLLFCDCNFSFLVPVCVFFCLSGYLLQSDVLQFYHFKDTDESHFP